MFEHVQLAAPLLDIRKFALMRMKYFDNTGIVLERLKSRLQTVIRVKQTEQQELRRDCDRQRQTE